MKTITITSFRELAETMKERVRWGNVFNLPELESANATVQRTAAFLEDIGLNPDARRSVDDISRLQTAIAWALGGER